jgi:hypothetical protein
MYKLITNDIGPISSVMRMSDKAIIPFDPGNVDYQQYQRWLAEGNAPLPPDA